MNKVVLISFGVVLAVIGVLCALNKPAKTYYVSSSHSAPKSIYFEPPTVDQIKKDLGGKTVVIEGNNHQFTGPELNDMSILVANPTPDGGLAVGRRRGALHRDR